MSTYLGIDLGTQSIKALLYDAAARRVIGRASSPLTLISRAGGHREQLAEWWVDAVRLCLSQLPSEHRNQVTAIGVSGQQHGFVPLAADGTVLAPVKLWCDTSTTAECEEITAAFGGADRCIEEVGNPILPGYTAGKIRWLRDHHPDAYRQFRTMLLPHDYLNFRLTGERVMEAGDASGTGLLDIRNRSWHPGMAAAVDPDRDLLACLPDLIEPDAPAGLLTPDVAKELGLPPSIPVSAGGGDNMMAAIGTGNVAAGRLTVSLGTSGTLFAYSDRPVIDEDGLLAAFCSSTGGWLPLLCTMNCTVATEIVRELFTLPVDEVESRAARIPAGSGGVVTLPFYNGERAPDLPDGKGCILGLDPTNSTKDHLLRSAIESATYALRAGLASFLRLGCAFTEIRLTGGGARNGLWRQIVADVFSLPVVVLQDDEGAALGAALQALWMHRGGGDIAGLVDEHLRVDRQRCCEPIPENLAIYRSLFEEYLRHVELISPLYSRRGPHHG